MKKYRIIAYAQELFPSPSGGSYVNLGNEVFAESDVKQEIIDWLVNLGAKLAT